MNNEINGTGFTAVNNNLLEAVISSGFSLREIKIILLVIRYTCGFRSDSARLSLRFISRATGIDFSNVNKTIIALIRKNVLSASPGAAQNTGRNISLRDNYNEWSVCSSRNNHSSQIGHSCQNSHSAVAKTTTETVANTTTKKEINKENINKVFTHWNSKNIMNHNCLNERLNHKISGTLNNYTVEEILTAIDNYQLILEDDDYYFKYKWTLHDFLQRGLEKFLDKETAENNYKKQDISDRQSVFKFDPRMTFNFRKHKDEMTES